MFSLQHILAWPVGEFLSTGALQALAVGLEFTDNVNVYPHADLQIALCGL